MHEHNTKKDSQRSNNRKEHTMLDANRENGAMQYEFALIKKMLNSYVIIKNAL